MKNLTPNSMDDLFKQHFEQTTVEVTDKEALWAAIGREQSSKKGLLFWFISLGILLIGTGTYLMLPYFGTNESIQQPVEINELESDEIKAPKALKPELITPIAALKSPIKQDAATISTQNLPRSKANTTKQKVVQTSNSENLDILFFDENRNVAFTNNNSETSSPTMISTPNKRTPISISTRKTISVALDFLATYDLKEIANEIKIADKELAVFDLDEINRKWDKCQVKQPGKLFLDLYGQASYPIETIYKINETETSDSYLDLWEDKISPFMSYQGGIQIGYQFPWKGYVSGGLSYQHFETKYENRQTVTERITVFDEMAYFYIDTNGETVWVADSVSLTNVYERQQTFANQHQLWHIPIQLGYITNRNNWRLGANIEGLINISKTYQGHFIKPDATVVELDKEQAKSYISNTIGLSLSGGIHIGYMLNENWEVYANPRFRTNNLSFLKSDQQLDIRYQFAGVRAGLKYWF